MRTDEFDKFAEEYLAMHASNIRASGESPEFFAEYKIKDIAEVLEKKLAVRKILDFGGGIGTSVPYVRRYFPNAAMTCLDVSERSLTIARDRYSSDADFVSFDGTVIPFDADTFDVAYAACVFHHIDGEFHIRLLNELVRVLRPDGWLFVFEHNPLNPLTRHAVNTCPFDDNAVLISGFRMKQFFKEAGLGEVKLRFRMFFPRFLSMLRCSEPRLTWLPLGAQYYVCGQKTDSL